MTDKPKTSTSTLPNQPEVTDVSARKVALRLAGLDGNAFSLLGAFSRAARKQGWSGEEIKAVCDEATTGDYNHLLRVLMAHTDDPEE